RLQAGKEEAAQDSAIDAAKTADDCGGKTDDPEIETDAEIDLVVIEPVHHARDGGERRANGECHQDDSGEIDAHGPGGFFVLRDRPDGKPELGPVEQILNAGDHQNTGGQHQDIVEPKVEIAEVER